MPSSRDPGCRVFHYSASESRAAAPAAASKRVSWLQSLVGLNFNQEAVEADMRYGLVRVRENAESIAFYGGQSNEMAALKQVCRHEGSGLGPESRLRAQDSSKAWQQGASGAHQHQLMHDAHACTQYMTLCHYASSCIFPGPRSTCKFFSGTAGFLVTTSS